MSDEDATNCCKVRNAVAVLGAAGCVVNGESILAVYRNANFASPADMLTRENASALTADLVEEGAAERPTKRPRGGTDDDVQLG